MNAYELEFEITMRPKSGPYLSHGVGLVSAMTPDGAIAKFTKSMIWSFGSRPRVSNWQPAGKSWGHAQWIPHVQLQWEVTIDTVERGPFVISCVVDATGIDAPVAIDAIKEKS